MPNVEDFGKRMPQKRKEEAEEIPEVNPHAEAGQLQAGAPAPEKSKFREMIDALGGNANYAGKAFEERRKERTEPKHTGEESENFNQGSE